MEKTIVKFGDIEIQNEHFTNIKCLTKVKHWNDTTIFVQLINLV